MTKRGLALALAAFAAAFAPGAEAAPVKIAIVSRTVFFVPLWIAARKGFLRKEGIDADIAVYNNADEIEKDLLTAAAPVAVSTPEGIILNAYRGGPLRIVGGNAERLPHFIIARPAIKTLAQLKGATFGVLSLKEGTSYMVRELAKAAGLSPSEYTIAEVGGAPARWKLLQEGKIDAGLQPFPLSYEAEAAGFSNLGSIARYVPDYLFTSVNANDDWARAHPALMTGFLRALKRGMEAMEADPKEATEIAAAELMTSPEFAARALADTKRLRILASDLSVSERALKADFTMLSVSGQLPSGTAFDPARVVDARYLAASRKNAP